MKTRPFSFLLFFPALFSLSEAAAQFRLVLEAGDNTHTNSIVRVEVPNDFPERGVLRGGQVEIPFQKGLDGAVVFVAPDLQRNQAMLYNVEATTPGERITARWRDGQVRVAAGGRPVFTYQGHLSDLPRPEIRKAFQRGGYIHPVHTPSGKVVTDDYPSNHIHHHGIWFPWTKTEFEGRAPDFWNMGAEKGRVDFVRLGETWSGPVHAGFTAEHRFVDMIAEPEKVALNETWEVTAYHLPEADYWVLDLVSTQTCATDSPLILPAFHYGGLGFRGNWAWNGKDKCFFLTSNGDTDPVKANETRANWCHIGGPLDEEFAGIAILGHPGNFRAPQPMRLHPTEPFFCYAPSQLGDWRIEPGKPYISRYRFIVRDGKPDAALLDQLWKQYANPPRASILSGGPRPQ